ncbi:ornithine carbamoyltransferase [Cocleimonas flava]|uniref:Ornithine carbamoyltransferase n=1 Tax=Cocleimonas flava TaxID=634765 RepID=A0A4R1F2Q2_9GAMM|nr:MULTISPECIES: ornithine carbamoyltransferase [Cocleimonas]MEB8430758.1 ornithine carbamoyltransferase [Cocleimonas sp. KMM 6892]MEC4714470.1 ornithine carbamoyltransferase [Cocleimonas sp. KMM 6895]MEC4743803.1 ornithine carbamoyltransferase [Cocleimonas sp. KMM 6896]TCJ88457.1 ornithine carbamoyltransferase [Cocleimonas flava]
MSKPRHFLTLMDFSQEELQQLIARALELKNMQKNGEIYEPLKNMTLAMIFEKSSTRTRVSFETGMVQLGGHGMFLSSRDTQLGRGEPIEDSARVISSMVDIVMIRTFGHDIVENFAKYSSVPVINALTDDFHPCQLLADMMTYVEHRGSIKGKTATYVGDGNNMCHSWMNAAKQFGFHLNIASPKGYEPNAELLAKLSDHVTLFNDIDKAVANSDLITTDVWASMGQEEEQKIREKSFKSFMVNSAVMAKANDDAIFMHCLPAHREEEVSTNVIDGPQSVVWDEAENRLHAQKALLEALVIGLPNSKDPS